MSPRTIGSLGAALLGVGVFAPIVTIPVAGTLNYFANGQGDGVLLLILAVVSLLLIWSNRLQWLFTTGSVALAILIAAFLSLDARLSEVRSTLARDLAANPFEGLAEVAMAGVQLQWGWAVLVLGASLLVAAALIRGTSSIPTRRCPFCAEMILLAAIVCKHCQRDVEKLADQDHADAQPTDASQRRLPLPVLVVTAILVGIGVTVVGLGEYIVIAAADLWL